MQGKLILVGGGARSGKSRFAMDYAKALGGSRIFVAPAQATDAEMQDRIQRHREERGTAFRTIEEPLQLCRVLRQVEDADVVLVDCLTLWLSNLLLAGRGADAVETEVAELVRELSLRRHHVVLVSNEVGLGIVPESGLGRIFRDLAGRTHQQLAAEADEVYFAALGLVMRLIPAPVVALRPGQIPVLSEHGR
jgi:adenosylcobinamide kinase/adenosylcobinamide-phosphate guanylyltransferase